MFKRLELILKNRQLQKENEELDEENKLNREDISDLEIKITHARLISQYTIAKLRQLEEIDRSGISEEAKKQHRNVIFNELRKENINIIKELDVSKTY